MQHGVKQDDDKMRASPQQAVAQAQHVALPLVQRGQHDIHHALHGLEGSSKGWEAGLGREPPGFGREPQGFLEGKQEPAY